MIVLDDWQEEALTHDGDLLLCTGRRVGKTYIMSRKCVDACVKRKIQIVVCSLTEDQAFLIVEQCREIAALRYKGILSTKRNEQTYRQITFKNGSKIIVRPVGITGDSLRGFLADILVIDEASRMPERFWMAALPLILTTAGKIWMSSTPHGKQGYFWERYNEVMNEKKENARYKVIYKTTEQVIRERPITQLWTENHRVSALKELEIARKDMSELEYGQEYLGLFLDELRQFFPDEIVEAAMTEEHLKTFPKDNNFGGSDLARMGGDAITYEVLHKDKNGVCRQIANHVKRYQPTDKTKQDIIDFMQVYQTLKWGIDAGSGAIGVGILDELIKAGFKNKIVAINNRDVVIDKDGKKTQKIKKQDLYNQLLAGLENKNLFLLKDDNIRLSFKSVQWEIRNGKMYIFGDNTHIVEGLTRAYDLARNAKINKAFITYI